MNYEKDKKVKLSNLIDKVLDGDNIKNDVEDVINDKVRENIKKINPKIVDDID